jgi:hypothetical protein
MRRFFTWLLVQMFGPCGFKSSDPDPRLGEQMASIQLYPTRRRNVELTARKRPGTVSAVRATTAGRACDEHTV